MNMDTVAKHSWRDRLRSISGVLAAISIVTLLAFWMLPVIDKVPEKVPETSVPSEKGDFRVQVVDSTARPIAAEVRMSGKTRAFREVAVRARTDAVVASIAVQKGQRVAAGDVLLRLSDDNSVAVLAAAQAAFQSAEINWQAKNTLQAQSFASKAALSEAKSALEQARSAVAAAELARAHRTITVPFDGFIHDIAVEVGDLVQNGTYVATVIDDSPVVVVGTVGERDIDTIAVGMSAVADVLYGDQYRGTITFVSNRSSEQSARAFSVEVSLHESTGIALGRTANVTIQGAASDAHFVPLSALVLDAGGVVGIKTANAHDTVVFFPVTVLRQDPDGVWVKGLPDRARIITVGHGFATTGMRVLPVAAQETE